MKTNALIDANVEKIEAPEPGKCRGCKYEPLSWIRIMGIGGHVYHEGRCKKRGGHIRAGDIANCKHWKAKGAL